ncbi:MAG: dihydroneopterin aldolase [Lentisphaeria bacterium]|jgi:FolB domain-containing protein
MPDRIHIADLALRCIIGTFPAERQQRQEVILNLELECDLRRAGESDALADTVDYKSLKQRVRELVENSQFQLLEKLAAAVARTVLQTPGVTRVRLRLDKPGALRFARSVAVEIERTPADFAA